MANAIEVPPDAKQLIFAVDVVHFFFNKYHPSLSFKVINTDILDNVNSYRQYFNEEPFTENVKKVLKVIDDTQSASVYGDFSDIKEKGDANGSFLTNYSTFFKDRNLNEGIQAGDFLQYCARLSAMACLFHTNDCKDALDIAVDLIKSSFPDDRERCNLLFEEMENAALKYTTNTTVMGVASYLHGREPNSDLSGTEDSSSSSACATETESEQSLTSLILRLNTSVSMKGDTIGSKSKGSIVASSVRAATTESFDSSIQNPTVSSSSSSRISAALKCNIDMPSKIEKYFKSDEGEPQIPYIYLAESSKKSSVNKHPSPRKDSSNDETANSSSRISEALKCNIDMPSKIEKYFKSDEGEPQIPYIYLAESSKESSVNKHLSPRKDSSNDQTASPSSRISAALKCNIDMPSKIEKYFKSDEGEPQIPYTYLAESSKKSNVNKRPSPRKDSSNDETDSEAEVKKPKFGLPEAHDENE